MYREPRIIEEKHPAFNAPVYHVAHTSSTMDEAKSLAAKKAPDGTVVYADFQSSGRGRIEGRVWQAEDGKNLLCTVLLRRNVIPGFTLRVGLAVALTFDYFLPSGKNTHIKWPNDILFEGKKLSGVLCENDGSVLYVGVGLNIGTNVFSPELSHSATSLSIILEAQTMSVPSIKTVLDVYLSNLNEVLEDIKWNDKVSKKLYRRGEKTVFMIGDPGKKEEISGFIEGIGKSGELLFIKEGSKPDDVPLSLFSGEIPIEHPLHL